MNNYRFNIKAKNLVGMGLLLLCTASLMAVGFSSWNLVTADKPSTNVSGSTGNLVIERVNLDDFGITVNETYSTSQITYYSYTQIGDVSTTTSVVGSATYALTDRTASMVLNNDRSNERIESLDYDDKNFYGLSAEANLILPVTTRASSSSTGSTIYYLPSNLDDSYLTSVGLTGNNGRTYTHVDGTYTATSIDQLTSTSEEVEVTVEIYYVVSNVVPLFYYNDTPVPLTYSNGVATGTFYKEKGTGHNAYINYALNNGRNNSSTTIVESVSLRPYYTPSYEYSFTQANNYREFLMPFKSLSSMSYYSLLQYDNYHNATTDNNSLMEICFTYSDILAERLSSYINTKPYVEMRVTLLTQETYEGLL